jgi:hypothetical protein
VKLTISYLRRQYTLPMGRKALRERRAVAQAKKKGKQSTTVTTDDEASTLPIKLGVTPDVLSETAFESDEEVAVAMRSLKAKASVTSCLDATVEDSGALCNI